MQDNFFKSLSEIINKNNITKRGLSGSIEANSSYISDALKKHIIISPEKFVLILKNINPNIFDMAELINGYFELNPTKIKETEIKILNDSQLLKILLKPLSLGETILKEANLNNISDLIDYLDKNGQLVYLNNSIFSYNLDEIADFESLVTVANDLFRTKYQNALNKSVFLLLLKLYESGKKIIRIDSSFNIDQHAYHISYSWEVLKKTCLTEQERLDVILKKIEDILEMVSDDKKDDVIELLENIIDSTFGISKYIQLSSADEIETEREDIMVDQYIQEQREDK